MLIECTHTYNGVAVKISSRYNYGIDPHNVEVYDPQQGEYMIAPVKELKAIPKGKMVMNVLAVDTMTGDEEEGTKKHKKKAEPKKADKKKKVEPKKKEEKKVEKKKEVKKAESKKKKELKKEDVTNKIDYYLEESLVSDWFKEKKAGAKLTLQSAYTGTIKFVKDLKSMGGDIFKIGKTFLAKKEPNKIGVKIYAHPTDSHQPVNRHGHQVDELQKPIKVVPFDILNSYIELLGMKGLPNAIGKLAVENKIENFFELNKGKK
jgi:hypothetical protein